MRTKHFMALAAIVALAVLAIGCGGGNSNNANANANAANTNANTKANTNANKAPTKEDVEKNKESYSKQAKDAGRKIGTGANDTWLWVKTRYDLAAADDLRDTTINVDVENGVITLTGTVATKEQLQKADKIAKAVEGQKGVQNKLKVVAKTNSNAKKK